MPNNTTRIVRNRFDMLSAEQQNDAVHLLERSGLTTRSATSRLKRAFLVLVGYKDNRPTATLTVKTPDASYVRDMFARAQVKHNGHGLELGYLYAEPGSGTVYNGPRLYREAMEVVRRTGTSFYAVTRADNATMTKYLSRKLGWYGSLPFASTKGRYDLILWTAEPQVSTRPVAVPTPIVATTRAVGRLTSQQIRFLNNAAETMQGRKVRVTIEAL